MKFISLFSMVDQDIVSMYPSRYFLIMVRQDINGKFKDIKVEHLYDEETQKAFSNADGEKLC